MSTFAVPSWLHELAAHRQALHNGQTSQRIYSDRHEIVGLAGEYALSCLLGLPFDESDRPAGDGGRDFVIETSLKQLRLDVKTARKPTWLIVRPDRVRADLYALCHYHDESDTVTALGWEWASAIVRAELRPIGETTHHALPADELRPIEQLQQLADRRPAAQHPPVR